MKYHAMNGMHIPTGILCALFCLLSLFPGSVAGQSIEPTVVQIPESPNNLDSVDHFLYLGTASNPLTEVYAIEMVYSYTGYQIFPDLDIVLQYGDSSWFNGDGQVTGDVTFDTLNREITVSLSRPSQDPRTGYGFTVLVPEIIIVIEDIGKRNLISLQVIGIQIRSSSPKTIVVVQNTVLDLGEMVQGYQLANVAGQVVRQGSLLTYGQFELVGLSQGLYYLRWKGRLGWQLIRLYIQ